jgi:hypothetical protein
MSATMSRKVDGLEAGAKRRAGARAKAKTNGAKGAKGAKGGAGPKGGGATKGGDGGAAPVHDPSPHHRDNALVCLTNRDLLARDAGAFDAFARDACLPTRDPDDTAHLHRVRYVGGAPGECVFLSNHEVHTRKLRTSPRRYHPSQMTSRGVGFDSMYDRAYRVGVALQDQGVELGWRPVVSGRSAAEHDRALALAGLDRDAARNTLRPRHRLGGETADERTLESRASAILRRAGLDEDGEDTTEEVSDG